ncbi:MAG: YihY family inner membrane protein [Legionella sp.]|nr:YihY family inner membrane protein [Legionella sp.]
MDWKEYIKSKWYKIERFVRFVITHFFDDDCPYRASALAFTSLLAIVPLMTVGFAILSSFPVFQSLSQPIQDFIFDNFVPATGKVIQTYLQQFTSQVTRLSIVGVAFLFVTAILLMVTIEHAMNKIWRTNVAREGVSAFLLYWAILSLAPVFVGLSLVASSYILSIPFFQNNEAPSLLLKALPFLLSLAGFTFLYVVVPNRPVKIIHGLLGALVTAILFESAKLGFAYYLSYYNSYALLYGAFATIPIFFVWIYWVWFITLLGAEFSYALSVHYKRRHGYPLDGFSHALLWLEQLWLKQKEGRGMTLNELIESNNQPFMVDSDFMINELKRLNLVHSREDGYFFLSRDLTDISLYWLTQNLPFSLPTQNQLEKEDYARTFKWHGVLKRNDEVLHKLLDTNLSELFGVTADSRKTRVIIEP